MNVLVYQLDGSMPNLACMRISAHHKALGDSVEFRHRGNREAVDRDLFTNPDRVYASAIFERTRPVCERVRECYPGAILGGTGWDMTGTLEDFGITTPDQDYTIYPDFTASIGFTQRGCRLSCSFCVVPRKEGKVKPVATAYDIWRGEPWPRHLILLDNDFFGQKEWADRIREIREGKFRVSFNQGINARMLSEEAAEAIASVDYRAADMTTRRVYTAWDNREDEDVLFRGLKRLTSAGVKPDHIMVYVLIGYWDGETEADLLYRQKKLRDFGCRPYPMPFVRNDLTRGFQRWVVGAYDKRVPWDKWKEANYDPRRLNLL